jgi:hypothetical protein
VGEGHFQKVRDLEGHNSQVWPHILNLCALPIVKKHEESIIGNLNIYIIVPERIQQMFAK